MDRHCLMRSRVQRSAPRAMRGEFRIYSKTMHAFAQKFSQDGWNIRSPFATEGIVTCPGVAVKGQLGGGGILRSGQIRGILQYPRLAGRFANCYLFLLFVAITDY